jgi:Predicted Fe-S oxidoreductases
MNNVYIEITNVCNLHCSFCPCGTTAANKATAGKENAADNGTTIKKSSMPASTTEKILGSATLQNAEARTFMPSELFEKCIAGAQEIGATNVYFHVLGEPTLHPGFVHYVKKLEQTPLKLTLTTNGSTIERTGPQILASPAVRQVNFSTHAYAELPRETAERYLQNVLDFCSLSIVQRPDLYINLRLWNVGAEEASLWNSYILGRIRKTFNVEVTPGHFCSRHKSFNITGRIYLHEDTRFEWPSIDERGESRTDKHAYLYDRAEQSCTECKDERIGKEIVAGTCRALDTHVAILHDGRVVACCLDHSGQITLGNISKQTLPEIINSPEAVYIKEGFTQHELRHPFCQTCHFCKRFK